ncbi:dehydrase and lipid transport-domain-containing protein [Gloeopeniophorella convolvens]|nr:dehydrase and lipid transport-domain-containing protein [Gloeopeniophorella convolvens]
MPITCAAPAAFAIARHAPRYLYHAQRRHLFNLPDLSAFSPLGGGSDSKPQTYHERKILPYTRRELYDVVADVGAYASFVPFCTRSRVLGAPTPAAPRGTQMEAELTVAFLAFTERYTSRVTCVPHESVRAVAASSTPLFKTLETVWAFQPASPHSPHASAALPPPPGAREPDAADPDAGPTLLSLELSFAFANPVHAAVSGAFFGKVSALMVKAFEERCLKVYGPGTQ